LSVEGKIQKVGIIFLLTLENIIISQEKITNPNYNKIFFGDLTTQGKILYTGHITEKIHLNSNTFSIPISAFSEKDSNEYISSPGSEYLNKKTDRKNFLDSFEGINTQIIKKKNLHIK